MYKIKFSVPSERSLAEIKAKDYNLAKRIISQIERRLPYDPYPDDDSKDYFTAMLFKALEQDGYDVWRLKSQKWRNYRVFYLVDEDKELIYILDVVLKDDDTYRPATGHVDTIKQLYIGYYNKGHDNLRHFKMC